MCLTPPQVCSYSCVYCTLDKTKNLQIKRECYRPPGEIFEEISKALDDSTPDHITFIGDGETTLYQNLGTLIRTLKGAFNIPIAVKTNSSLLYRKDVRQDLEKADIVIPSLDAGDARVFNLINRPHAGIDFHMLVKGLTEFRKEFGGLIWMEVMLVRGINDAKEELLKIKQILERISPDRIYLLTPVRPSIEEWVSVPDQKSLNRAIEILGQLSSTALYEPNEIGIPGYRSAREAILSICSHYSLRYEQAEDIVKHFGDNKIIGLLISEGLLAHVNRNGHDYLILKPKTENKT